MLNIIPKPDKAEVLEGFFYLNDRTSINDDSGLIGDKELRVICSLFSRDFKNGQSQKNVINVVNLSNLESEEYTISVDIDNINIHASSTKGILYAFVSLKQICINNAIVSCKISDKPKYSYRGFMLDVARHFFNLEQVMSIIDLLFFHKINYLHLHLSDDQGFRIELKGYEKLLKASIRPHTKLGDFIFSNKDYKQHSGYYSIEDVRKLIDYAKLRNINIIPEIDMPGHTMAILSQYPELNCFNAKVKVWTWAGISRKVMCMGKKEVYDFASGVVDALSELFQSEFIHLGGDECSDYYWSKCPHCQNLINEKSIKSSKHLQAYFFKFLADRLAKKNKKIIGWNECIHNNDDRNIIAQYWTEKEDRNILEHLREGGKVILSRCQDYYFNLDYSYTNVEHVYNTQEIREELKEYKDNILGLESCLWTENVEDMYTLTFRLLPRLTAFSEVCWSNERDYEDYKKRYEKFKQYYEDMGVNYCVNPDMKLSNIGLKMARLRFILNDKTYEVRKYSRRYNNERN